MSEIKWLNETAKVSDVKAWDINPRKMTEKGMADLKDSVDKFGLAMPIIVNQDGTIIGGHARLNDALARGSKKVDIRRSDRQLDEDEIAELNIRLNKNIAGEFDMDMLANHFDMDDLLEWGFEDWELGIDVPEVEVVDANPEPTEPEKAQNKWNVSQGDMWKVGNHRIICGDCTDIDIVERLFQGEKINACITDPPYGLANTVSDKNNYDEYNDSLENLLSLVDRFLPIARQFCDRVVLTPGVRNHFKYPEPEWTMAWFTPSGVGRGPWGFCCWQPILCYGKDAKLAEGKGSHPDAIVHTESSEDFGHPCSKPINFWRWLVERCTNDGHIVYDPFNGSGTTMLACAQSGRTCYAIELSPAYVAVTLQRLADAGYEPELVND
jgi:hypothetical protein